MKNETTTTGTFYQLEIITPSDSYGDLYATKAEAYEAAEQTWNHLTRSEKAERAFYIHTYGGALKDGETLEDAFLRLIDDNATEEACTKTEALYSTEGDLMDDDDSLGWCSAYEIANGEAVFVMNEGEIVSILYQDGTEIVSPSAADIEALARKANPDYEEYDGWKDETILMDAPLDIDLLPCRSCPWFFVCDAMQETRSPY